MQYGLCNLSVVPLRLDPADPSEMVNQVLFGECFAILEARKKWSRIRLAHDKYEGWIDSKQLIHISEEYYKLLTSEKKKHISTQLIEIISNDTRKEFYPIFLGSFLPFLKDQKVQLNDDEYSFNGQTTQSSASRKELIDFSLQYMHAPYLWGGRTPAGIDCSGFTQMVYRLSGHNIPRDASEQAKLGQTLSFIEESEVGDLAFFDNSEGKIVHVGIILEDNYILHASGKVRLDRLDQTGIFNAEIGQHTHKLRVIKKIIKD